MAKKVKYPSQARYQAKKAAEGAYVQVNVKFKTANDVAMFEKLRERFPDDSDSKIVRNAVKEMARKKN
jgi:hypothetical protein